MKITMFEIEATAKHTNASEAVLIASVSRRRLRII